MINDEIRKKTVYTVTFHNVLNVGACLQAYALQKFISNLGFDCKILNYTPIYFLWKKYRPALGFGKTIKKIGRISNFNSFKKNNLTLTRGSIFKAEHLNTIPEPYAYVCGSDQIWNSAITNGSLDDIFMLNFRTKAKKIAYAASSGGCDIQGDHHKLTSIFGQYSAIGVREGSLGKYLKKYDIAPPIQEVADPTFLIEDYSDILDGSKTPKYKYIASYEVSNPETREKFDAQVNTLKTKLNLPVIHLGAYPINSADKIIDVITPGQWLSIIRSAEFVITNSFHGLAISLNFNRPVVNIAHIEKRKNERSTSLLRACQLDYLNHETLDSVDLNLLLLPYDRRNIINYVENSIQFLSSALLTTNILEVNGAQPHSCGQAD